MTNKSPNVPRLVDIRKAAGVLAPYILRSPLLQSGGRSSETFLKFENLKAIGAFKARPAGDVMLNVDHATLRDGVYTASSGNAGLGLAWGANIRNPGSRVFAPVTAPWDKLAAIRRRS